MGIEDADLATREIRMGPKGLEGSKKFEFCCALTRILWINLTI